MLICKPKLICPPSTEPTYNTQVTLYNSIKVDSNVKEYLFKQAQNRKYKVVLNQLTEDVIKNWKPVTHERWMDLDPYLDIEDIGNDSSQDSELQNMDENLQSLEVETETPRYGLHQRKNTTRRSSRPLH